MKTIHHLIVALMQGGMDDTQATAYASETFADPSPRAKFGEFHKTAKECLEQAQRQFQAIDHALIHWGGGDPEKPYANGSEDAVRLREA